MPKAGLTHKSRCPPSLSKVLWRKWEQTSLLASPQSVPFCTLPILLYFFNSFFLIQYTKPQNSCGFFIQNFFVLTSYQVEEFLIFMTFLGSSLLCRPVIPYSYKVQDKSGNNVHDGGWGRAHIKSRVMKGRGHGMRGARVGLGGEEGVVMRSSYKANK